MRGNDAPPGVGFEKPDGVCWGSSNVRNSMSFEGVSPSVAVLLDNLSRCNDIVTMIIGRSRNRERTMKIIGINGSPRGEDSPMKRLIDTVLSGAQENGAEIEITNLIDRDCKV
ncbi:hypothetical protein BN140_0424 [Methanoculleus bourgensis MS2]|jgi:hypothetical protein|uniref:NADPH-dependent FMN reductase-like domain-containing protein n=1 Tax=Methanoculleus bourgensis (strain ATCC 43281 / DSM 3045 / OCM 15 / MS2) TaxID=1201294 RepID=I7LIV5_METBM|nr:hypothetical protein [Methanoculleus bourgensis]CCJ35347.1 hypothetical protein BN140_0424 [Methanoculleus bourgensis MS2]